MKSFRLVIIIELFSLKSIKYVLTRYLLEMVNKVLRLIRFTPLNNMNILLLFNYHRYILTTNDRDKLDANKDV